jgi:NAD dependent epimerase/dehydratase family enzyme
LSKGGGALKEFIKPLNFGIAAILGSGKQIISWIHIDDLVSMFIAAIENENMNGVYNAVAPNPVSNKELTLHLAKSRNKLFIQVHVPSFVLKIVLGEMSIEVLKSATISCEKIYGTGFNFHFPDIHTTLENMK